MKDYSKLRPFDLVAARDRGELLTSFNDISQGNPVWRYAAGPDSEGKIIATVLDNGRFTYPSRMSAFRMVPLAWVRKSADEDVLWPVYKGDVLYDMKNGEKCLVSHVQKNSLCDNAVYGDDGLWNSLETLSWNPPKVKREGWLNIYPGLGTVLHKSQEMADSNTCPDRVACVRVEWEE